MYKKTVYILSFLFTLVCSVSAQAQIMGSLMVCAGGSTTLTDVMPGGTWTSGAPSVATVGLGSGVVHGVMAGTATISYTIGMTVHTAVVTVNPLPSAGTLSGASVVCTGAGITLTAGVSGGVWSASNGNATVTGGAVMGITPGVDTIIYTVTTSCGTATATKTVTINTTPPVSAISGVSAVCESATITLSDATAGGIWTSSNATATVSGSGVVAGVSAGVDTIMYSVSNACGITTVSKIITINPLPVTGGISGASMVCEGATITLSAGVSGGVWNASNATATVTGGMVMGVTAGIDTINYTVTNGCGAATATVIITINPVPVAGTLSGATDVCEGATTTLTASVAGGVWGSYFGWASVAGGVVTGVIAGEDTIMYSVTTACGTATAIKVITVNPMAFAGTISGPGGVCIDSTVLLTTGIGGGIWNTDDATIANIDAVGNVDGLSPGTATISYVVTNSCGTDTAFFSISVDQPVTPIVGPDEVCQFSIITLLDGTPGGTWSSSSILSAVVFGGTVLGGIVPGTVTITYTVTNGCGTTTATKDIDVIACPLDENIQVNKKDELQIFPNPNAGAFTCNLVSGKEEEVHVVMTDMVGKTVHEFTTLTNKQTELTLNVPAGIYMVNAATAHGNYVKIVVVQ